MALADFLLSPFADLVLFWWLPPAAVVLDRLIGDPPGLPHPVRWIGRLLPMMAARARRLAADPFMAGVAATVAVLIAVWLGARLALAVPVLGTVAAVYLSFAGLALGQLLREGRAALALIESPDLEAGRRAVGFLVSRDVSGSDRQELRRVLAESLAENFNDGFVAPMMWLALGGPVALWLYKAASTMDSMWGYRHEPWTRFGTPAARLDDALAFIPARLSVLFLLLAARLCGLPSSSLLSAIRHDAATMASPNAGWPMAACARIHGAAMGGPAVYAGKAVDKPVLGPPGTEWTDRTVRDLIRHLSVTGRFAAVGLWLGGLGLWTVLHGL